MDKARLRIIPLGGLGEIGRNMLVFEYDDELMVVDAGLMFPDNDMLGVDIVLPDMSYLYQRADRVRGIIITHGHEDHIGALPYLLERVQAPIYATALTRGLIEVKLPESQVRSAEMYTVAPGAQIAIGPFVVECFHVSHSIPDGIGLAIHTPLGVVVHSGDFKFDHNPWTAAAPILAGWPPWDRKACCCCSPTAPMRSNPVTRLRAYWARRWRGLSVS